MYKLLGMADLHVTVSLAFALIWSFCPLFIRYRETDEHSVYGALTQVR